MKQSRLTKANQLQCLLDDVERVKEGRGTDFSVGQHLALIISRLEVLEKLQEGKQ